MDSYTQELQLAQTKEYKIIEFTEKLEDISSSDLDFLLRIISLIPKYYTKCTNNMDWVKATMQISYHIN